MKNILCWINDISWKTKVNSLNQRINFWKYQKVCINYWVWFVHTSGLLQSITPLLTDIMSPWYEAHFKILYNPEANIQILKFVMVVKLIKLKDKLWNWSYSWIYDKLTAFQKHNTKLVSPILPIKYAVHPLSRNFTK